MNNKDLETINSSGDLIALSLGGTTDGNKVLTSDEVNALIPDVTGLVPYTGGNDNLDLGANTLTTARVNISNIPTSVAGLVSGDLYSDSGTLKIVS